MNIRIRLLIGVVVMLLCIINIQAANDYKETPEYLSASISRPKPRSTLSVWPRAWSGSPLPIIWPTRWHWSSFQSLPITQASITWTIPWHSFGQWPLCQSLFCQPSGASTNWRRTWNAGRRSRSHGDSSIQLEFLSKVTRGGQKERKIPKHNDCALGFCDGLR